MTPNHYRSIVDISQRHAIALDRTAPAPGSAAILRPACRERDGGHYRPLTRRRGRDRPEVGVFGCPKLWSSSSQKRCYGRCQVPKVIVASPIVPTPEGL